MRRKLFAVFLVLVMAVTPAVPAMAANDGEIVVYYTNDVHSYIDNAVENETGLTYSKVAALKDSTPGALLVDAGDHVQGTAFGGMDDGKTVVALMNAAGYDAATLGNHEFDYGMSGCMDTIESAEYPYVSCNFRHEKNGIAGDLVLDSYVMLESGGKKIAFVGITTPETITSSTPAYFQDGSGSYIYDIDAGSDGQELYASVQAAVDEAAAGGADYIIALGHLGVDPSSEPWTSRNVIANVTGLDAFIDGHSHTTLEMEIVRDKGGDAVILTQTGSYLDTVGKLTISADGSVSTRLLTGEELAALTPDAEVKAIEDNWISSVNGQLGEVIGYAEITLDNYDSDGNRLVRRQGTNTGDFAADALYYLFDEMGMEVDVAVMNGGGIRNGAVTGELSYLTCKEIHTFGNVACLLEVTGQQLLDALEWGSKGITADGSTENGSLLHVSGLTYTLDLSYTSTVQADEKDVWTGPPTGEYRVKDVQVWDREKDAFEPLDLSETYRLAGYNYTLRDLGGGFAMLNGAANVLDYVAEDYMVLANYIRSFPVNKTTGLPTIPANSGYADVNGSGRITILMEQEDAPVYVGGVELNDGEYLSESGRVTETAPSGGYAYYKSGVLTLNDYTCQGKGYLYGQAESEDKIETYYALIYSEDSLQVELIGESTLTAAEITEKDVYIDGIISGVDLTVRGPGSLVVKDCSYGLDAKKNLVIRGLNLTADTANESIGTFDGTVIIENAALTLNSEEDGIFAGSGLTVANSTLTIAAQKHGIYSYTDVVSFDGSDITISAKYAIQADEGDLTLGENLSVLIPEQGAVKKFDAMWDADGDGVKETPYHYHTIADTEGNEAGVVVIRNENAVATRAEAIYDLWTLAGKPVVNYLMTFTDVPQEAWYAEAIRWAASEGIASGYGNNIFGPEDPINRQQMAAVLYRYEQKQGGGFQGNWMFLLDCTDRAEISEWVYEPMCWMSMHGILSKDDTGALLPRESIFRIEVDKILTAYLAMK